MKEILELAKIYYLDESKLYYFYLIIIVFFNTDKHNIQIIG